nr:6-phospho-3-hexuloisomerase [uncultured Blautia sp.]
MEAKTLQTIIREVSVYGKMVHEDEIHKVVELCAAANRIFVAGAGRSGCCAKGFANRLMHLGKTVHVVGEITTPSIQKGDLLVLGSGSGTTESLVADAKKASKCGALIATITLCPEAPIGQLADAVVTVPGVTWKSNHTENAIETIQPGGSLFEQLSWLIYDSIIVELMDSLGQTEETMTPRHANLE